MPNQKQVMWTDTHSAAKFVHNYGLFTIAIVQEISIFITN